MNPRVGVAVESFDVPIGTPMAGFAARTCGSSGIHDTPTARALVIDRIGLVTIDVCVLHEDTCRQIEAASDLPHVIVAATHTHAGPSIGQGRVGPHDPTVHRAAVTAALTALDRARHAQQPCTLTISAAHGLGVAHDRRHLERTIDPPLSAITITTTLGQRLATLVHYPCHPVVLDATNTLISADYIGSLRSTVEQETGAPCVFLTGCAGDVNTGHSAAASYTTDTTPPQRTMQEAIRIGTTLAAAALTSPPQPIAVAPARYASRPVDLDVQPLTQQEVNNQRHLWLSQRDTADSGTQALLDIWIDWATTWQPPHDTPWRGQVSALHIGDLCLIFLPGEPFLAVSDNITTARHAPTLVAGYSNGVPGYLPMATDYPDGGYEVADAHRYYAMPAPFAPGSAERLIDAALTLLEEA